MEAISVAKKFAIKVGATIDLSQELIALSLCNCIGGVFQAYPSTGSLSRTAENYNCNSKSPVSSLVTWIGLMFVLLFTTSWFYYTPKTILSAIVICAAISLVDLKEIKYLWQVKDYYALIQLFATLIVTFVTGPEHGVEIAVAISISVLIYTTAKPYIVILGRLPGTVVYKNIKRYPDAVTIPGILIFRIDSPLTFYNVYNILDNLYKMERKQQPPVRGIIIESIGINYIDSTALPLVEQLIMQYTKNNVFILFADLKGTARDNLAVYGLDTKIGLDKFFLSVNEAVLYLQDNLKNEVQPFSLDPSLTTSSIALLPV